MTINVIFDRLPDDVLLLILSHLDNEKDCQAVSCTSTRLKEAMMNAYVLIAARVAPDVNLATITHRGNDINVFWQSIVISAFAERDFPEQGRKYLEIADRVIKKLIAERR